MDSDGLLTTAQVCEELGITSRYLRKLTKLGLQCKRHISLTGKKGRPQNLFDIDAVRDFIHDHSNDRFTHMKMIQPSKVEIVESKPSQLPVVPATEIPEFEDSKHHLVNQLNSMIVSERQMAIEINDLSIPARDRMFIRQQWIALGAEIRKTEAQIPKILHENNKYVDIDSVVEIVSTVLGSVNTELDDFGERVAPLSVGLNVEDVARMVDDEINLIRRKIVIDIPLLFQKRSNSDDSSNMAE